MFEFSLQLSDGSVDKWHMSRIKKNISFVFFSVNDWLIDLLDVLSHWMSSIFIEFEIHLFSVQQKLWQHDLNLWYLCVFDVRNCMIVCPWHKQKMADPICKYKCKMMKIEGEKIVWKKFIETTQKYIGRSENEVEDDIDDDSDNVRIEFHYSWPP